MIACKQNLRRPRHSVGYTLIELMIGMASSTLLISGLASTLYISSQALNLDDRPARQSSIAAEVLGDMMADLRHALSFSERTATAVTFTVPDRDNDGLPETIRYGWSGTPGDALTYEYNSDPVQTIAKDVQVFDLTSITRLLLADPSPLTPASAPVFAGYADQKVNVDSTAIALFVPSGTSAGDLLVAVVATDGNNTDSLLAAADWTAVDIGDRVGKVTLGVWWKVAAASEPIAHGFAWSTPEEAYGWMMRFTGNDTTSPIDASAFSVGKSVTPLSPSVTTSVENTLVVRIGAFDGSDITVGTTGLAGHTSIAMDSSSIGGASVAGGAGYLEHLSSGATATAAFALANSKDYRTVTIAIAPNPVP